jgi:hypothetical protein
MQLWAEEVEILARLAASVPDGGTIVEIGTAEGGTALLMSRAAAGRGVRIHTVDVSPSALAFEHLRGTGVDVVARPSEEYAGEWKVRGHGPIDFLFIDGNHDLEHVVSDWNLWVPHLRPGGRVAFHDFDPRERGGVSHLAVRVGVETVLRSGELRDADHRYKLVHGTVESPEATFVQPTACRETLARIAIGIREVRDASHAGACLAADERTWRLLQGCLRGGSQLEIVDPSGPVDPGGRYLAVARAPGQSARALREHGVPEANLTDLDSATVSYLLAGALRSNYSHLAACTADLKEFLVWAEALQMLDHGCGIEAFPDALPPTDASLGELSAFVAREQVRLVLLGRALRTFVEWIP